MAKFTRREFLKISATAMGSALLSGAITKDKGVYAAGRKVPKDVRKIPSFCEMCFWKCGIVVTVEDGVAKKIEGNPYHPLSNGRLCPRGVAGIATLYSPDRLTTPLIRVKDGNKQYFKEADWNTALDYVAERLMDLKKRYGASSVALVTHGFGASFFKTLLKAYGSSVYTAPSFAQCRGPVEVASKLTYGELIGSPERFDIENAKAIALIGSHWGENMHNTVVQWVSKALSKGATFIVVDPRYSIIASKSRYYLPIKPATDLALLLAWINVLIYEELYHKEFVENYTDGFEELKAAVSGYTPEWASRETGIKASLIRETAYVLARNKPSSFVYPGRHVVWYGDDTQRERAMHIINALLGAFGAKGGMFFKKSFKVAKYPAPRPHGRRPSWFREIPYPFGRGYKIPTQLLFERSIPDKYGDKVFRGWFIYGSNLPQAVPTENGLFYKAVQYPEFIVVIDIVASEMASYADVVLPDTTYLERYDDLHTPGWKTPYVALRQPVVKPLYNSKPAWWIAKELAKRMGLSKYFPYKDIEEYLRKRAELSGINFETLKKYGVVTKNVPEDKLYGYEHIKKPIHLYSKKLASLGFDPVPKYVRHPQPKKGYFRLIYGRAPVHTFTRTAINKYLLELVPENPVYMHPNTAKKLGLKANDKVILINDKGVRSLPATVKITPTLREDCFYTYYGFGRRDERDVKSLRIGYKYNPSLKLGKKANLNSHFHRRGFSTTVLTSHIKIDPIMGGTGLRNIFVRVEKI